MPCRNLQTIVLPQMFFHKLFRWFDGLSESVMLWIDFFENCYNFSCEFFQFVLDTFEKQSIINLSSYRSKSYVSYLYTVLQNRRSKSQHFFAFHTFEGISSLSANFLLLIFVSTNLNYSSINYPSLIFRNFCDRLISDFRRVSKQILKMFFPLVYSFVLDFIFALSLFYQIKMLFSCNLVFCPNC